MYDRLSELNLYQKLAAMRKLTDVIQKTQSGFNYKYVSITEILARVSAGMNKYNVSLIPQYDQANVIVEPHTYKKVRFTKDGKVLEEVVNEYIAKAPVNYMWIDNETGESITIPWYIAGSQSDPSQAMGSAMTYGLRQFLTQFFQIAQPQDDPDNWRTTQKEAEEKENKEIAKGIIDKVNDIVSAYLETHPDGRSNVVTLVKKYAKEKGKASANYFAITDPNVATALLQEVEKQFGNTTTTIKTEEK